jgi:prepilin-type N-terminal cleavage/methylation domain-containing protein
MVTTARAARSSERGFSLIEILVATAIIATLLAIAYPNLATLASGARLEGAARTLVLELQKSRLRAIAEGKCCRVTFNGATRRYQLESKAGVTPCGTDAFTNDGAARVIDDTGAIVVTASASPTFDSRGRASTTSVITLTAPNGAVLLAAVNAAGRVNVQ